MRRELREQIAHLEEELSRLPRLRDEQGWAHLTATPERAPSGALGQGARMLSTADLAAVRDELLARLHELDHARAEVIRGLERLERVEPAATPAAERTPRRPTPTPLQLDAERRARALGRRLAHARHAADQDAAIGSGCPSSVKSRTS